MITKMLHSAQKNALPGFGILKILPELSIKTLKRRKNCTHIIEIQRFITFIVKNLLYFNMFSLLIIPILPK